MVIPNTMMKSSNFEIFDRFCEIFVKFCGFFYKFGKTLDLSSAHVWHTESVKNTVPQFHVTFVKTELSPGLSFSLRFSFLFFFRRVPHNLVLKSLFDLNKDSPITVFNSLDLNVTTMRSSSIKMLAMPSFEMNRCIVCPGLKLTLLSSDDLPGVLHNLFKLKSHFNEVFIYQDVSDAVFFKWIAV